MEYMMLFIGKKSLSEMILIKMFFFAKYNEN